MLYYDRIEFSEDIDVNKMSRSKEYIICYYLNIQIAVGCWLKSVQTII